MTPAEMAIGIDVLYLIEPHTGCKHMAMKQNRPKPVYAHCRSVMDLKSQRYASIFVLTTVTKSEQLANILISLMTPQLPTDLKLTE